MNISRKLQNKLYEFVSSNASLFEGFERVYLFGSIIKEGSHPHDIDLLLIYLEYTNGIIDDAKLITSALECEMALPLDITVLSKEELMDTHFLDKINNYVMLK